MRLPVEQIKEAILHSDLEIRDRAIRYFGKSHVADVSIMPMVIKAVEEYGRQDAYRLIGASRDLQQTEDTIAWLIEELNDEQSDQHENYTYNLSMVLVEADPTLLLPKESAILEAHHFLNDLHQPFSERLQMLSWDFATCWQRLEEFCEDGKDKQYVNEINLSHANRIVEALARFGTESEEKVRSYLTQQIDDYSQHPMKWMEPLAARLAGQARLESTVSLLIAKLHEDADLLNEECAEALTRIGTPDVIQAVANTFSTAPQHFRLYATEPLEYIHSDLAVEKCLQLLASEKEFAIRCNLARALLSHFASEGIEETRQLLVGRKLDFESTGLRNYLLETCTIMGERFPEYDNWLAEEKADKEEHFRRIKELEGDPEGMLLFALEKLTGKKAADAPKAKPSIPPTPHLSFAPKPKGTKAGRNDPCPCGSGKKFKNCCLKKQKQILGNDIP